MTKFLLDSGNIEDYKNIAQLAKEKGSELWGATTNPSLVAKELKGQKVTTHEANELQKKIVMKILEIVPGAVSAEVYADSSTSAEQMIEQGREIAKWHERIVVKLPTTKEGFKARNTLRKEGIAINNTLVFSPAQIFAVCLHEKLIQTTYHVNNIFQPPFISPFLGRIDDRGEDGLTLIEQGLTLRNMYFAKDTTWILASSIRNLYHIKRIVDMDCDIITAPAKVYQEWFTLTDQTSIIKPDPPLKPIASWQPSNELLSLTSLDAFMAALESGIVDISHPLTDSGLEKFTQDWKAIIND